MFILKLRSILLVLLQIAFANHILAQEKVDVELVCPENVVVNCEAELKEIGEYGKAMYRVGEEVNEMEDQRAKKNIDECGKGTIERLWRYKSEDDQEFRCSQIIYIGENENGQALINWPDKEVVVSWCNPSYSPNDLPKTAREPEFDVGECSLMEHRYADEIVYKSESCKEVHRIWTVYDWCYDSKNIKGNDGHYKFTQIIKFEMPDDIDYLLLKDIEVESEDCEKATVDMPDVKVDVQDCNRRIKVSNDSPFADSNGKNASGVYPVGETVVTFKMELECTEDMEYAMRIIVNDPCKEKAIIEQKELEVKMNRSFVRPNPFTSDTEILLTSDIAQTGILSMYKTSGELISERNIALIEGTQKIMIQNSELSKPGVYYYSILIGERKLEGRLIKIR